MERVRQTEMGDREGGEEETERGLRERAGQVETERERAGKGRRRGV